MTDFPVLNFQDFISADGGKLTTTSRHIAAVHGKRHDDVLRLVRKRVSVAGEWGLRNFTESQYANAQGKIQPMIAMTRDGYAFIVGKLTGKLAAQHQIAYIEAFNAMAAFIQNQAIGLRFRLNELELADKDSKRRGSIHGRGLRERGIEKPVIEAQIEAVQEKLNPLLPMFDAPSTVQ